MRERQEMLDFCAAHGIVIDLASLREETATA